MNAIAYSLYGRNPKYCIGAIKNVQLAARFYPGWKVFLYVDWTVPSEVIAKLKALGAEIVMVNDPVIDGLFWRFWINDMPGVDRYIIRDSDSRIGQREVDADNAWIASGKSFHVMRDHPHHDTAILGGVWGAKRGAVNDMTGLINRWEGTKHGYDSDQEFLRRVVWPMVKDDSIQHDSCLREKWAGSIPFPTRLPYNNPRFCCEVFDAQDNPRPYDWEKMLNYIRLGA